MNPGFRRRDVADLVRQATAIPQEVERIAAQIVDDVRRRGEPAVREYAERLDQLPVGAPLVIGRTEMRRALEALMPDEHAALERITGRIRAFAECQRDALASVETAVPGGRAGHTVSPVQRVGCYAPGGRYPLPSSLLMTALTARVAGVPEVWVASSRPNELMLACAALAEADGFVTVGGAQGIAAFAFGAGAIPRCDMIVGPGSAYVTAAKRLVFGQVGIDALAGPSELVVVAGETADPAVVAADLLAQAEHDPSAIAILVTTSDAVIESVSRAVDEQLLTLPTADVARAALANGGAVLVRHLEEAVAVCDRLAPEHLHLHLLDASSMRHAFRNYGVLFIGSRSAEVLGDYGAGPNHVLPTGGAARFSGGLSVLSFLRVRTWLEVADPQAAEPLYEDAAWLAGQEGLPAHARSANQRLGARANR